MSISHSVPRKSSSLFASEISIFPSENQAGAGVNPGLLHLKIKGKILNAWGIYCALVTFSTVVFVYPVMRFLTIFIDSFGNRKQRRLLDWIIHYWAKVVMMFVGGYPTVIGKENLPKRGEVVVYVPNHTSFLDIFFFSGFVPRPFKYLSKAEIGDIPLIGAGMKLALHILLKRDDITSVLESTGLSIERLKQGNSMVLFAEGTRSPDGRLQPFKKGAFQIAKEAKVNIVPVSIANLYRWMPSAALLPLGPMRNTYIKIHPPIDSSLHSASKLKKLCFEAVNSGLPDHQKAQ